MRKNILLTGASTGFGLLTLKRLLQNPSYYVVAGIRGGKDRLTQTILPKLSIDDQNLFQERLKQKRFFIVDLHLENPETFKTLDSVIQDHLSGEIDVLINNAGYGLLGPSELQSEDQIRHQMEVNFMGTILLTKKMLPLLRKSHGKIISLSSVAGLVSFPFYASYNASKYALEGYMEALAFEMKTFGVQICLVEPGGFRTDFNSRSAKFSESADEGHPVYGKRVQGFQNFLHKKSKISSGDPDRVAELLVNLVARKRIPLRKAIGLDSIIVSLMAKFLPSGLRFRLEDMFFRKMVFHEL